MRIAVITGRGLPAVALAAIACSATPDRITRPAIPTTAPSLNLVDDPNPVIMSVTGHWEVIGGLGALNKVSVNALERLDGTVSGDIQYEQQTESGLTAVAHATVICMTVEGNRARLAAVGERRTDAGTTTGYGFLTAIDNGEGAGSVPDSASNLLMTTSETRARAHCAASPPMVSIFEIERGDVQVR